MKCHRFGYSAVEVAWPIDCRVPRVQLYIPNKAVIRYKDGKIEDWDLDPKVLADYDKRINNDDWYLGVINLSYGKIDRVVSLLKRMDSVRKKLDNSSKSLVERLETYDKEHPWAETQTVPNDD